MQHSTDTHSRNLNPLIRTILALTMQCSINGDGISGTEVVNEKVTVAVTLADGSKAGGTTVFAVDRSSDSLSPRYDSSLTDAAGITQFTGRKGSVYALSLHHSMYASFLDSVSVPDKTDDTVSVILGLRGFLRVVPGASTQLRRAAIAKTPFSRQIEPGTPVLFDRLSEGAYRVLFTDGLGTVVRDTLVTITGADTTHLVIDSVD